MSTLCNHGLVCIGAHCGGGGCFRCSSPQRHGYSWLQPCQRARSHGVLLTIQPAAHPQLRSAQVSFVSSTSIKLINFEIGLHGVVDWWCCLGSWLRIQRDRIRLEANRTVRVRVLSSRCMISSTACSAFSSITSVWSHGELLAFSSITSVWSHGELLAHDLFIDQVDEHASCPCTRMALQ
jgi:hypothetical protein